jgi:hypothetical protein
MSNSPPPPHENCAVHGIKRKRVLGPTRPRMTILPMRIACWITKATTTHSEYVRSIAFPWQQCLDKSAPVLS